MKKAILFIASFLFVVIILSAFADKPTAPGTGYKAPEIAIGNDTMTASLNDCKGEYLLVTFWSSTDANSRIRCNEYTAHAAHNDRIRHIGVNFDHSEPLFNEIVKRDNLSEKEQYHVEGDLAARIKDSYHLDRGLHSFLIDPEGIIIAVDPDAKKMSEMLI